MHPLGLGVWFSPKKPCRFGIENHGPAKGWWQLNHHHHLARQCGPLDLRQSALSQPILCGFRNLVSQMTCQAVGAWL